MIIIHNIKLTISHKNIKLHKFCAWKLCNKTKNRQSDLPGMAYLTVSTTLPTFSPRSRMAWASSASVMGRTL